MVDDLCPICQADEKERKEEVSLACCKKVICRDCLVAWQQNSNLCPLCKAPFETKEEARQSTLTALHRQVVGVNRLLQKVASLSGNVPMSIGDDPIVSEISQALDDVFDSAVRLGFGPPRSEEGPTLISAIPPSGQLFSRELLSFALDRKSVV